MGRTRAGAESAERLFARARMPVQRAKHLSILTLSFFESDACLAFRPNRVGARLPG
jgi:hypothetical protein